MGLNGTLQTSRIITQFRLAVLCVCQFIMAQVQLEREYQEARRQEVEFFKPPTNQEYFKALPRVFSRST